MSKPRKSRNPGPPPEAAGDAGNVVLHGEEIFVTRLEVEANSSFDPDARQDAPMIRRLLRVGEDRGAERLWYLDFEVASTSEGAPYRYLVHFFVNVAESSTQSDREIIATEVAAKLTPRLFMIAGEQLFAASIRGPWGPISLPPDLPVVQKAKPVTKEVAEACSRLTELLEEEGPMSKAALAAKIGDAFERALNFAIVQGLAEEKAGQILLRPALGDVE